MTMEGDRVANPQGEGAWEQKTFSAIVAAEHAVSDRIVALGSFGASSNDRGDGGRILRVAPGASSEQFAATLSALVRERLRVSIIAAAADIRPLRDVLHDFTFAHGPAVLHVIARHEHLAASLIGELGWGVLVASGVAESVDFALIARRAAEDSDTPWVVIHEPSPHPVSRPELAISRQLVSAYLGEVRSRPSPPHGPGSKRAVARARAERVPFALASAMRDFEALGGAPHDVFERSEGQPQMMFVAAGELGESLLAHVDAERSAGRDVGAIRLKALRPFPGARLVKVLARSVAVTVIESADDPLSCANPLAAQVKSAFVDALTWAPEFPGIGRIPRILSAVLESESESLRDGHVEELLHHMSLDERGKRLFLLGSSGIR
jgi:pyruvate ferredoxin oxidoreductase alpha subunit